MAEKKSKILIIGGTGYIGKFIVEASAKSGHPTFALVMKSTLSDPEKEEIVQNFRNLGVTFVLGDIFDHHSLLKAIKQVDVVISAVGFMQTMDQVNIIAAIKEAGNIKRFFPYEFGNDVDEPPKPALKMRARIRKTIKDEGIPFTSVVCNPFYDTEGDDIATYIIRAVDDPSALNQVLSVNPPLNTEPVEGELEDLFKGLHSKLEDAEKKVGELLETKKYRIQELEEQNAILQKKCSDSEAESVKNAEKVAELESELESVKADFAREGDVLKEELIKLQKELESANEQKEVETQGREEALKRSVILEQKVNELEKKLQSVKAKVMECSVCVSSF